MRWKVAGTPSFILRSVRPAVGIVLINIASVSASAAASLYSTTMIGGQDYVLQIDPKTGALQIPVPVSITNNEPGFTFTDPYSGILGGLAYGSGNLHSTTMIGGQDYVLQIDPKTGALQIPVPVSITNNEPGFTFTDPYSGVLGGLAYDSAGLATVPLPNSLSLLTICLVLLGSWQIWQAKTRNSGAVDSK